MHRSPARPQVVLWLAMLAFGTPVDAHAHRLSVLNPARATGNMRPPHYEPFRAFLGQCENIGGGPGDIISSLW